MAHLSLNLEPFVLNTAWIVEAQRKRKVFIVGRRNKTLANSHVALVEDLIAQGYEVMCAAAPQGQRERELEDLGARFVPFPLAGGRVNPLRRVSALFSLYNALQRERPDVVLSYDMGFLGNLVARVARVKCYVPMVEGQDCAYVAVVESPAQSA